MGAINNYAYYRLFGYLTALVLHGGNGITMLIALQGDIIKDPELETFYSLQWVYITIWNVAFQIIYSFLGILCDSPTSLVVKETTITKYLKYYREVIFTSIILPLGFVIFIIFWPIYIYDREMVFPAFIDKVLRQESNHIMHTAILPIVLWEFVFLPKTEPKSHKWNLAATYGCYITYLYVLFSTFARRGIWPYPILKICYGSIYFPTIFIVITIMLYLLYYGQWRVNALLWGTNVTSKEKIC
ncbi:unnamed protein product [Parnassius apollo]|uniref:(apollo) hypothetical protein n=1 Tax=Parnassius apollo TaxID=110799 RepID=A0A8S3WFP6_PARAO|nr:unnamed protein product [Parnassius apollo]